MAQPNLSSLWLMPPESSTLNKTISGLINSSLPPLLPTAGQEPPNFVPHLTLTASTIPTPENPQEWLDALPLPDSSNLVVRIGELHVGEIFFQKLIQLCSKTAAICELAAACRASGTGADAHETRVWIGGNYVPHVSLIYSDLPPEQMRAKLELVGAEIRKAKEAAGEACLVAEGAEIWLVPTFKEVREWVPIARRRLEDVKWEWKT